MKVSVIIPCYNSAPWLSECLDSVLNQSLNNFEVICINDGSLDETPGILKRYESLDPRVAVITQENRGLSSARNAGMEAAAGDYVYFLDSDDLLADADSLSFFCTLAEEHQLDVLVGEAAVFYAEPALEEQFGSFKERYALRHAYDGVFKGTEPIRALRLNRDYYPPVGLKLYRASFLRKNHLSFIEGQLHEDDLYSFKSLFLAERAMAVQRPLYKRRIRRNSIMTRGVFPANALGYLMTFIESLRFLEEHRKSVPYDAVICFGPRSGKNMVLQTYLALNDAQKKEFVALLTPDQRFYFDTFIADIIKLQQSAQAAPPRSFLPYISARVDIRLISSGVPSPDIRFTHVSDLGCKVTKPGWFQAKICGYVLHSYAGELELRFVPQAGGKISLNLRGMDVRNPEEKTERIPYWIDYTSLHINGTEIFSSTQPVWHDKPYKHSFAVSEGEEVSVLITWLPHRSS